jgi:hypothetical protein
MPTAKPLSGSLWAALPEVPDIQYTSSLVRKTYIPFEYSACISVILDSYQNDLYRNENNKHLLTSIDDGG